MDGPEEQGELIEITREDGNVVQISEARLRQLKLKMARSANMPLDPPTE